MIADDSRLTAAKKSSYPGYTDARRKANKAWAEKQSQIAIRVKPDVKAQFDAHCKSRGESLAAFVVRSGLNQIERDAAAQAITRRQRHVGQDS